MKLSLSELLSHIQAFPQVFAYSDLGKVSESATDVLLETMDISEHHFILDTHGILHSLKKHSSPTREALRGQDAIEISDFELIPTILHTPDTVVYSGVSRLSLPVLLFTKHVAFHLFSCATEVRTLSSPKKARYHASKIAVLTLYKRKTA